MSLEKFRSALVALIADPENQAAWDDVEEVVTGSHDADVLRELEQARASLERVHVWAAAVRLLDFEVALAADDGQAADKQLLLGRLCHEELLRDGDARSAFERVLAARPDDAKAKAAIAEIAALGGEWRDTASRHVADAEASADGPKRARHLVQAAELVLRNGARDAAVLGEAARHLEAALVADPEHRRALTLAALVYEELGRWAELRGVLESLIAALPGKTDKIAAASRLCRLCRARRFEEKQTLAAHGVLLDLDPGNATALAFLVDHFTRKKAWVELVALYEDQLSSGAVKHADELGVWVQIAMLSWATLKQPQAAEPYFEKVRRADPTHLGMLRFFRERCAEKSDNARLSAILTDAQRATTDEEQKRKLAAEIARLAEVHENARAAIEQYKSILRSDPNDREARERLRVLYEKAESWNALVELHRQELQRLPKEDVPARIPVLREMAAIYSDRMKNDAALLTVLTQLHQLDEKDIATVHGLVGAYERLQRWRDLILMQQKLADLTESPAEKAGLLRSVARRWLEQFSNVQNAMVAYEALIDVVGDDVEAREKLRDLYEKRRIWPKLYELYEKQLASGAPERRVALLTQMAKLAAERLDRGDDAIRLWREIYEAEPATEGVLDALERLGERQKDFRTVAFVLERRIDEATDDKTKLALLLKLGGLRSTKLEDERAAAETWRRVLEVSPGHGKALRALRQSYVDTRDYQGLEELYGSQGDWESLADFLSTTADRVESAAEKIDLSFRAARVFATELCAPERAARSFERVLAHDPQNLRAAEALLPLYEQEEKWSRLPGLYGVLLEATEDVDEKIGILHKMASVTGGPLANKALALQHARRAYELRPDDEGLRRLKEWSQESGEWATFMEVLRERLETPGQAPERERTYRRMLADVYASQSRVDDGIALYRQLVEADLEDRETVNLLEQLLRANDRRDDLRWLFDLQAGSLEGEAKLEILEEWAAVEEEVFAEHERAIELYEKVVAAGPARTTALGSLARLLAAEGRFERAAEVLCLRRDASEGGKRVAIELELAAVYLDHLKLPEEAFHACERVLDLDAGAKEATLLLERLLERASVRGLAAAKLEGLYGALGQHEKRATALRAMLELEDDSLRRLELCARLAELLEQNLGTPEAAFDVALNTLLEAPDDLAWWDRAQALSVACGKPTDMAEAYRKHLGNGVDVAESPLNEGLRLELCERAAGLHERELGDAEGAAPYYERMLAIEPRNLTAFERLETIFDLGERWQELERLYFERAESADSDADRIAMWLEAARVAEDALGDDARAIAHLGRARELEPLNPIAVEKLGQLLARAKRYDELAKVVEQRVEAATDEEAAPFRLRLAELYLHSLSIGALAMPHLEALLRGRADDAEARKLAEECLELPDQRQAAAALLDEVYTARDDVRDLVRVLHIRLEGTTLHGDRRELVQRIADLADERLKDDKGSFAALSQLVLLEPDDESARARFVEVGRRLARNEEVAETLADAAANATDLAVRGELYMTAAQIRRDSLDQPEKAEALYREVLALDPNDAALVLPAAEALATLLEERADHGGLASVLYAQAKLTEGADRVAILERVALLFEEVLDDRARAIDAYKEILAQDPSVVTARRSLERLYEETKSYAELCAVLREHEQYAEDGDEREACLVRRADVLCDELGETAEAITAWRGILDDFGPKPAALASLAKLYQRAERWEDLADVLDVWLSLEEDRQQQLELYLWLGDLRRKHLGEAAGALEAYRAVLERDAAHAGARGAIEALLEHADADVKRKAAETLGPIYRVDGDAARLLKVLEIEIATTFDLAEKLELLERALSTAEDVLQNAERAFELACTGVREALGDPSLAEWVANAERLAEATERQDVLLELYEGVVEDVLDSDLKLSMLLSAAGIARTKEGGRDRAIRLYRAALEARVDDRDAMLALEELYGETGDNESLLEVLELRADSAPDEERVLLLVATAKLRAGPLGDVAGAIRTYEDVLELGLSDDAVAALDLLYRQTAQYDSLVGLYERQLSTLDGKAAADVRARIAEVLVDHVSDGARALEELGQALEADPHHDASVVTLERMLESAKDPEHQALAAEMLEPVYLRRSDWSKLKGVLETRREHCQEPGLRAELLQRLGTLYEEQLEDFAMALETAARRLREDPSDETTWVDVERLGRVLGSGSESRVAEIFAAALTEVGADDPTTAALCERTAQMFLQVSRREEALHWYRRSFEFTPDSPELFEAIDELLVALGRREERIDHYRGALDDVFDEEKRASMLRTVASLETELGRLEPAVETWRSLLEIAAEDEPALDALEGLYRKLERAEELCELFERRAEAATDPANAATFRLALAAELGRTSDGRARALEQLEEIVRVLPEHERAIAAIEAFHGDAALDERASDVLRPIYEGLDAWRKLIALGTHRLARTENSLEKAGILLESARLWEDRGGDLGHAFEAARQAFETAPEHDEARAELERLAEATGRFHDLALAYERALEVVDADDVRAKVELLGAIAVVADERLDDPRRTLAAMRRLQELEPTEPEVLDRMDDLAVLLGDWDALLAVLLAKAELPGDAEACATVFARLGELKQDMLEDEPGAIASFEQALELSSDAVRVIDRLIALYDGRDVSRMVELLERRIEAAATGDERRAELALRAARACELELHDNPGAIRLYTTALEFAPTDAGALAELERLFEVQEDWGALLDNLKTEASLAPCAEARLGLRKRIAALFVERLGNPVEGLAQYAAVLDESPEDVETLARVRKLGEDLEELRLDVARMLEPIYTAAGRFGDLVLVLELRVRAETSPAERARTLAGIALIQEEQLDSPKAARDSMMRALGEAARGDDPTAALEDDVERLCELADDWGDYADLLEKLALDGFDARQSCAYGERLGRIAEDKLGDPQRAKRAYARAVEQSEEPATLLLSLDRLYTASDEFEALDRVLVRRLELDATPSERAELCFRAARLRLEKFADESGGFTLLSECAGLAPDHAGARKALEELSLKRELFEDVAEVLDTMYRVSQDSAARARLRSRRIDSADGASDRVRLRLDLAQMLEDESFDTASAQEVIERALVDAPSDPELLERLERLAAANAAGRLGAEAWRNAASAVTGAVTGAREAARESSSASDVSLSIEEARDLYSRVADWYEREVRDVASAEKLLCLAHELDRTNVPVLERIEAVQRAAGRERDLVTTLRRLAGIGERGEGVLGREPSELRREAKILAETALEDAALVEAILREILAGNESDAWALGELSNVCRARGDFDELLELLKRRIEGELDAGQVRELRREAAAVAAEKVGDSAQAVELYEQLFEAEPTDEHAALELNRLFEKLGRFEDILRLNERLLDLTDDAEARAKLRLASAELCLDKLDAPTEAVEHLNAALAEVPGQAHAVEILKRLYTREGRDEELAELVARQIDAKREQGDGDAELALRVELAELYETKLSDPQRAVDGYLAVLEVSAGHRGALEALGRLYEKDDRKLDAAETFEKLLAGAVTEELARLSLKIAELYAAHASESSDAAASRVLEQALGDDRLRERPTERASIEERLEALFKKRGAHRKLAALVARRAERQDNEDDRANLHRRAAEIFARECDDHAAAAEQFERAASIQPNNRELMLALCDEYTASGRGDDALAVLQRVVDSYAGKRTKELADIHLKISAAQVAKGDDAAALRELEAARKMDPGSILVLLELGKLSIALADRADDAAAKEEHVKRAAGVFKSLMLQRLDAGAPVAKADVFYYMAEVNRREGDPKKALHNLERAIATDKEHRKARKLLDELRA